MAQPHHDRPWAVIRQYPLHRKTIARYALLSAAEKHAQFLSMEEGNNYRVVFDLTGDDDFKAIEPDDFRVKRSEISG